MALKKSKYVIASFFLIAFLTAKVISVHGFVHFSGSSDMTKECAFCDDFLAQNAIPFITVDAVDFKPLPVFAFREVNHYYDYRYYDKAAGYNFYNRPPPFYS
ncbi:MAG: hypothetical protein AAF934_08045 [Bacteroidota bacterium]